LRKEIERPSHTLHHDAPSALGKRFQDRHRLAGCAKRNRLSFVGPPRGAFVTVRRTRANAARHRRGSFDRSSAARARARRELASGVAHRAAAVVDRDGVRNPTDLEGRAARWASPPSSVKCSTSICTERLDRQCRSQLWGSVAQAEFVRVSTRNGWRPAVPGVGHHSWTAQGFLRGPLRCVGASTLIAISPLAVVAGLLLERAEGCEALVRAYGEVGPSNFFSPSINNCWVAASSIAVQWRIAPWHGVTLPYGAPDRPQLSRALLTASSRLLPDSPTPSGTVRRTVED
jgi:hypothetical protein